MSKLISPYSNLHHRDREIIQTSISPEVVSYFRRIVFAGTKGALDATLAIFLSKLHNHLAPTITSWDFTNEQRVIDALNQLNFDGGGDTGDKPIAKPRRRGKPSPDSPTP